MADDTDLPPLPNEAKEVWKAAQAAIDSVFEREITPQEFYYLLSCYPYLEICDANNPYIDETKPPEIYHSRVGWTVVDYGSVLITGACEYSARSLARLRRQHLEEEGESGDDVSGGGTIVRQFSEATFDLINIAQNEKKWKATEIVSGYYPMQRMAWIAANEVKLPLKGFSPTAEDRVVQNWVMKLRDRKFFPFSKPIFIATDTTGRRVS